MAVFSGRICRRYCHLDGIKNERIKKNGTYSFSVCALID